LYIDKKTPNPHLPVKQQWLDLIKEDAVDSSLPMIDPHHHLWNHEGKPYMINELLADINTGHNIVATVAVEARAIYRNSGNPDFAPLGEVEFINGIAAMSASGEFGHTQVAAGIVGHANLLIGEKVQAVLDAQISAASSRFKGIRMSSIWHPDPSASASLTKPPEGLLLDSQFRTGFKQLTQSNLSFDAWLYHTQIDELIDLVKHFDQTTIILNHTGGPNGIGPFANRRQEVFDQWRVSMKKLAQYPNVYTKVGGMGMKVFGFDFADKPLPPTSDELLSQWKPYIDSCIEIFGSNRCMFESNFPVDKGTCSYAVLWNCFKKATLGLSVDEKRELFFGTANKAYRLNLNQ